VTHHYLEKEPIMTYTPNSLKVYIAAYAGAFSAMTAAGKIPTDSRLPSPVNDAIATVAGAFAQQVDTTLGSATDTLFVALLEELSYGVWEGRLPPPNAKNLTPASYAPMVNAMLSILEGGALYFAAQGIPTNDPAATQVLNQFRFFKNDTPFGTLNDGDPAVQFASTTMTSIKDILVQCSVPFFVSAVPPGQFAVVLKRDGSPIQSFLTYFDGSKTPSNVQQFNFSYMDVNPGGHNLIYSVEAVLNGAGSQVQGAGPATLTTMDLTST
jgi:hypothetical protein